MTNRKLIYNFRDTAGSKFEEAIIEHIGLHVVAAWGKRSFEECDMETDQFEGTDCIIYRNYEAIRLDPTLNFSGKNRMRKLRDTIETDVGLVRFGIRYGNEVVDFEEPVMVIGFDIEGVTRHNAYSVVKLLDNYLDVIINKAADLYMKAVMA